MTKLEHAASVLLHRKLRALEASTLARRERRRVDLVFVNVLSKQVRRGGDAIVDRTMMQRVRSDMLCNLSPGGSLVSRIAMPVRGKDFVLARQQLCQVVMLANDLCGVVGMLDNLTGGLERTSVDHAIRRLGE